MNKIPTAEEFLKSKDIDGLYTVEIGLPYDPNGKDINRVDAEELFTEFAKLHVQAALEAAAENYRKANDLVEIDKASILNAYPPKNIK